MDMQALAKLVNQYLSNPKDDGAKGRAAEVIIRTILNDTVERVHPLGVADISKKCKGSTEAKTGCGWLVSPCFTSKEEALEEISSGVPNFHCRYIGYIPKVYIQQGMTAEQFIGVIRASARVYTRKEFINCVAQAGLFVAKESSRKGVWGVAIQQFKNSLRREALWYDVLQNNGRSMADFEKSWKG